MGTDQLMKTLKEINERNNGEPLRSSFGLGLETDSSGPGVGEVKGTGHRGRVLYYVGQLQILEGLQARLRNEGYSDEQIQEFDQMCLRRGMDRTLSQIIEVPYHLSTMQGEFDFMDRKRRASINHTNDGRGSPRRLEEFLARTQPESLKEHKL